MSERFNFYDVYGYLIPGFALLALFYLPVGIASHKVPDVGFADALGGLLVAYILGHILYGVTALAFPSGRRVSRGEFRQPSDDLLDDALHPERARLNVDIRAKIKDWFAVDLGQNLPERELREVRERAFRLCRDRLVIEGKGTYAEQFQGMYAMMRGISGASVLAAYYLLGWLISIDIRLGVPGPVLDLPMVLALAGLGVAALDLCLNRPKKSAILPSSGETAIPTNPKTPVQRTGKKMDRLLKWARKHWPVAFFWLLVGAATSAGVLAGVDKPLSGQASMVAGLAAGVVFLSFRCYTTFQHFASTFADTVYRNFLALPKKA
jgi:hypothetical protein